MSAQCDSEDEFNTEKKPFYANRRQYLVTYSQADMEQFPTRDSFCDALIDCFQGPSGKVVAEYWACCLEEHENTSGYHYHASVKLSGPKRWDPVRKALLNNYGLKVNFSDKHDSYYSAYRYVSKKDPNVFHSPNHPDLQEVGSPKTKKCIAAFRKKCSDKRKAKSSASADNAQTQTCCDQASKKPRRLSNLDVSEFLVKNNIKTEEELMSKAKEQLKCGKKDLANFVYNRSEKSRLELIKTAWKMEAATASIARGNKNRMELIREASSQECVDKCEGRWLELALETLRNNRVHFIVFATAMRNLLVKGRGKHRNILIVGPAECAKTFLFSPLQVIFKTFSNPSTDKYAWIGADKTEIIFLNDFRWSAEMIAWKELLLLLEGQTVHLPAPKNHYAQDICIEKDTPIVATGIGEITFVNKFNQADEIENEMMRVRWKIFKFTHQIPRDEQIEVPDCPKCFSDLILMGDV